MVDRTAVGARVITTSNLAAYSGQAFCDSSESTTDSVLAVLGAALTSDTQEVTDRATTLVGWAFDEVSGATAYAEGGH